MTKAVNIAQSAASGVTVGYKNKLINGGFQVWQRGTTGSVTNAAVYNTADRWLMGVGGTCTVAQSASPNSPNNNYYLVNTTTASSSYNNPIQAVERLNVYQLRGQYVTFSFWTILLSGSFTGNLGANLYYSNSSDAANIATGLQSPISGTQYSTPTGTWQQIKATYLIPSDAVGLSFCPQLTVAQASGTSWGIADCQVEIGTAATNFDFRPYGTELALCQRYFQLNAAACGYSISTTSVSAAVSGFVSMRASPTVAVFDGTNAIADPNVAFRTLSAAAISTVSNEGGAYLALTVSTTTSGKTHTVQPNKISYSAEL